MGHDILRLCPDIRTDVLIVGAGAAGIRAALAASEAGANVVVLSKGNPTESGSTFSKVSKGWGIQALVGEERTERNLEAFYDDIIDAGLGTCDATLVRILVEESGSRFEDLVSHGIRFRKNGSGDYLRVKGCFSPHPRSFVTENFGSMKQSFLSILNAPSITHFRATALELIVKDGECWGGWALPDADSAEPLRIHSKSTIIATGGGAGIFSDNLVSDHECGDGYCMAHLAGAELINMEYIQIMLGLKTDGMRQFLPLTMLSEPNGIVDAEGNDLIEKTLPNAARRQKAIAQRQTHFPFSSRDSSFLIDEAVANETEWGRSVFWKADEAQHPVQVIHLAHAFNGGIKIDEKAESTLPGLFAAGEAAAGMHGADRIGGCMMTATQVFGARAGKFAAQRAKGITHVPDAHRLPDVFKRFGSQGKNDRNIGDLIDASKAIFSKGLMVVRRKDKIKTCKNEAKAVMAEIRRWTQLEGRQMKPYLKLNSILMLGRLISKAAVGNDVSTGSHYRPDGSGVMRASQTPHSM